MVMDPHPTPFPGKRRSVAAPAAPVGTVLPRPKSIATARSRLAKKSPTNANGASTAAAQPRPRRVFGTVRSTNVLAEKPAKLSPPQKPTKQSPPNQVKATKPSRPTAKPLKKAALVPDPEAKAKKKGQRVSFHGEADAVAAGSREKLKAASEDAAGHTPVVSVKTVEKPVVAASVDTPFFSAQHCSNCRLDQLELATYWLAQICLAESVGKHSVAAAFFGLAFECQAQPIHRVQSELRNYLVRHESARASTPLFDELLLAHGMPMNQPKFDADGFEMVDKPLITDTIDGNLNSTALEIEECLECHCGGDLVDVRAVTIVKQGEEGMGQPSFESKLEDSFEFDDCKAVVVDRPEEAQPEPEKNVAAKVPCSSDIFHTACKSSIEMLSLKVSPALRESSSRRLLSGSPSDKLSPSKRGSSAERLSSGNPLYNKSPFGRDSSSSRLLSSCPSNRKSSSARGLSSKRLSCGSHSDGEPNAVAGAGGESKGKQEGECTSSALVDQLGLKEHGEDAATDEIH